MSQQYCFSSSQIKKVQKIQRSNIKRKSIRSTDEKASFMLQNQVRAFSCKKLSDYCKKLKENILIKAFNFQVDSKSYIFDKILPIEINNLSLQNQLEKSYLIPSQIFTVISPTFLNGLESYLEAHPAYRKQRDAYTTFCVQNLMGQMQNFSQQQQKFILQFLQKHSEDDQILKQFVHSILRFNYFTISDVTRNEILLRQTKRQVKLKQFSFYQLYLKGNNEVRKEIISQIIGQRSYIGRYSQLYRTSFIQTPFCIKYEGQYVAMAYTRRLNQQEYSKKLKCKRLVNYFKQNGEKQILYIYTLYVLPKFKGKGHGSSILNVFKSSKLSIVLCSSSSSELSGLNDSVGNSYFYKKCGFTQYFPLEVDQCQDQQDRGCLLRNEQHTQCHENHCYSPNQSYLDQSYYVYLPNFK